MSSLKRLLISIFIFPLVCFGGPKEQAKWMFGRLVGTQPTQAQIDSMAEMIENNNPKGAANLAMQDSDFYNFSLKNWVKPWSNKEHKNLVPLNDYVATVIGFIRDDKPFNTIMSADSIYLINGVNGVPAYSHENNNHYIEAENRFVDLSNPQRLIERKQSELPGSVFPADATAGVLTTRAAGSEFFFAGTNRAMVYASVEQYLCRSLEEMRDSSLPVDRIRQDVSRNPGGSQTFFNECLTCHNHMDAMMGAFAYYDYVPAEADSRDNGRVTYSPGEVTAKHNNLGTLKYAHEVSDDSWKNYLTLGKNSAIGWRDAGNQKSDSFKFTYGNGAKSLGKELAQSKGFSACQVKRVMKKVCLKDYTKNQLSTADLQQVEIIAKKFEDSNYKMKEVFSEVASYCVPN